MATKMASKMATKMAFYVCNLIISCHITSTGRPQQLTSQDNLKISSSSHHHHQHHQLIRPFLGIYRFNKLLRNLVKKAGVFQLILNSSGEYTVNKHYQTLKKRNIYLIRLCQSCWPVHVQCTVCTSHACTQTLIQHVHYINPWTYQF